MYVFSQIKSVKINNCLHLVVISIYILQWVHLSTVGQNVAWDWGFYPDNKAGIRKM